MVLPSNFSVDVTSVGKKAFESVLSLFFRKPGTYHEKDLGTTVNLIAEDRDIGLAFFEYGPSDRDEVEVWYGYGLTPLRKIVKLHKLPQPMSYESVKVFAWNWLKSRKREDYGREPDIDGSCSRKAWRIHGNGNGWYPPLLIVKNEWAEYHK
jgi:hypothetical protein